MGKKREKRKSLGREGKMKSFNEWLEDIVDEEMKEKEKKDSDKFKGFLGHNYHDRLIQLYAAYQNYLLTRKTHWLVIVTICLALATTVLSIISIFII